MERKDAAEIIKECAIPGGSFSKALFVRLVNEMNLEDFSKFCREILLLTEHYDRSISVSVCDILPFIHEHPEKFYQFKTIDVEEPVTFKRID